MTDKDLLFQLRGEFAHFKEETQKTISALKRENASLKDRLAKYENPKNSSNCSVAPSQDPYRKTKSLRGRSNMPQGAQKGHKGSKLKMVATPDLVVLHDVEKCGCCGNSLSEKSGHYDARQVIDIPTIKMHVTEHRRLYKKCKNRGKRNKGDFPNGLIQVAQYGNSLKSLCVYLQNYQMLPFARCRELIADLTRHSISTGSPSNFQVQCSDLLQDYEQGIRTQLLRSAVLHADETRIRLNGKNS